MTDPNLPAGVPDPADLPEMEECPKCNGEGAYVNVWNTVDDCDECDGTGLVEPEAPEYTDEWNGD